MSDGTKTEAVTEVERLTASLFNERVNRNRESQRCLELQSRVLREEAQRFTKDLAELWLGFQQKYKLGPQDRIDFSTGEITRVEAPKPALTSVPSE